MVQLPPPPPAYVFEWQDSYQQSTQNAEQSRERGIPSLDELIEGMNNTPYLERKPKVGEVNGDLNFVRQTRPRFIPQQFRKACGWTEKALDKLLSTRCLIDEYQSAQKLKGVQRLSIRNHKSLLDFPLQRYNHEMLELDPEITTGRANIRAIPFLGLVFDRCGFLKLPFMAMGPRKSRLMDAMIYTLANTGNSLGIYTEGGRNYGSGIKKFRTGLIEPVWQAARDKGLQIEVVTEYVNYSPVIEQDYFETLKKVKGKYGNIPHIGVDLWAFTKRYVRGLVSPTGMALHVMGPTFPLGKCASAKEVSERAYREIVKMHEKYYSKISNWPV